MSVAVIMLIKVLMGRSLSSASLSSRVVLHLSDSGSISSASCSSSPGRSWALEWFWVSSFQNSWSVVLILRSLSRASKLVKLVYDRFHWCTTQPSNACTSEKSVTGELFCRIKIYLLNELFIVDSIVGIPHPSDASIMNNSQSIFENWSCVSLVSPLSLSPMIRPAVTVETVALWYAL